MSKRGATDYSASLLDLLLGALGVIALFVFLFAAIRRNAEERSPAVDQFLITIKLSDERWAVGRDVGFSLEDPATGQLVELQPGESVGENELAIKGAPYPQHRYNARITTQAEDDLKARLWIRSMPRSTLSNPVEFPDSLKKLKAWCYLYEDRDRQNPFLEPRTAPQFDAASLFSVEFDLPVKSTDR